MLMFFLQLQIQVLDGGTPRLGDTANIVVNVNRNLASPVFSTSIYRASIIETKPVGETIRRVTATDPDNYVSYLLLFRYDGKSFLSDHKCLSKYCYEYFHFYPDRFRNSDRPW